LSAAVDREESTLLGSDAGEMAGVGKLGVAITSDVAAATAVSDVIIDFTLPEVTMVLLPHCISNQCRLVIGTTGFTIEQKAEIKQAAEQLAIVLAPNMSVGVNLT